MALRFKLKMKDDTEVRNLEELKENFDIEKIIGYFIDGKLIKWLESFYYEEELVKVQELEKNDLDLAKKLCDIFQVEYQEEILNIEEIELKNKRIQLVKQITDDEEVINNIENVAFNQEELEELYNKGVQTIYLLKGEFSIPKSKYNLDYKEYGNPKVTWPKQEEKYNKSKYNLFYKEYGNPKVTWPKQEEKYNKKFHETTSKIFPNPLEKNVLAEHIADKISIHPYVITENYIVIIKRIFLISAIVIMNKNGKEIKTISKFMSNPLIYDRNLYFVEKNKVLFNIGNNGYLLYDIDEDREEIIGLKSLNRVTVYNKKIIYYSDYGRSLTAYDLDSKQNTIILKTGGNTAYSIVDKKLFTIDSKEIFEYSFENGQLNKIYELEYEFRDYILFNNNNLLYIFYKDLYEVKNHNLIAIDLKNLSAPHKEIFRFTNVEKCEVKITPNYFVYNTTESDFPIYVFNMKNCTLKEMAKGCGHNEIEVHLYPKNVPYLNKYNIVENFIYYYKGEEKETYRVDIISGNQEKIS